MSIRPLSIRTITPRIMIIHFASAFRALRSASFRATARRLIALLLIATVGPAAPALAAVTAEPAAQASAAAPQKLQIVILEGEDSISNIRERTAREPIVQVEDENHKPVAGALVLFAIQGGPNGASASFSGVNTLSVTTDAEGKAIGHGLKPNGTEGSYSIAVSATVGALVATTIIKQTNAAGGGGGGGSVQAPPPPVNPAVPPTVNPAVPPTVNPAAPTSGGVSSSSSENPATSTPGQNSTFGVKKISRVSRLPKILQNPVVFGVIGVVVVTVAVRTAVVGGTSPTTITAGTGTVGKP